MPADPQCKSVFLVDDHPVLRRGLAALIDNEPDLSVCGEAASFADAIAGIERQQPDLAIVDLILEQGDGLHLVKKLKVCAPSVRTLVLSMHDETIYGLRALRAGALGYISKGQLDSHLLDAIRSALEGRRYMSEQLTAHLAQCFVDGAESTRTLQIESLSDRELQVFEFVGNGRPTREIAAQLALSIKTIESHIEHIKHKFGISTASELARCSAIWVGTGQLE